MENMRLKYQVNSTLETEKRDTDIESENLANGARNRYNANKAKM